MALQYGVGRVKIHCAQVGDSLSFEKILADPTQEKAQCEFVPGSNDVQIHDELGSLLAATRWQAGHLIIDATVKDTNLPTTFELYREGQDVLVQEMTSCKATAVKCVFRRLS